MPAGGLVSAVALDGAVFSPGGFRRREKLFFLFSSSPCVFGPAPVWETVYLGSPPPPPPPCIAAPFSTGRSESELIALLPELTLTFFWT